MHLETRHFTLVKEIVATHIPECEVWAYGSRVHGEHLKKFSDLDLVIKSEVPQKQYSDVKEAFSESNLPIKVDISKWEDINTDFRKIIENNFEVVQTPSE